MNRVRKPFGAPAVLDPAASLDWGDGFLMRRGITVVWTGWQADAPRFPGAMTFDVPSATLDEAGRAIRGLARSDWVVDEDAASLPLAALGHEPNLATAPDAAENRLTRRRGRNAKREVVPRSIWGFDETGESIVAKDAPFEEGWIYELVYVSSRPRVLGLGFAAFRDFARYVTSDGEAPFTARHAIAHGLSQSGRFLRHFLYDGFNRGASGEPVFDGMMIQIGGAGRGGFNHRFGHPGRVGNPTRTSSTPVTPFPSPADRPATASGRKGSSTAPSPRHASQDLPDHYRIRILGTGRLSRPHDARRNEGRCAPRARTALPRRERTPLLPALPPEPAVGSHPRPLRRKQHRYQCLSARPAHPPDRLGRSGCAPPPSTIPTISDGTLVPHESLDYPIADLVPPRTPHVADRLDFGPRWPERIIDHQPPKRGSAYAIRVPALDALGNEATGLRALELQAPIGTYTPWALRHGRAGGADEMTGYIGSFLPLALVEADRRTGDARPALRTLYPDRDAYETRVAKAIDQLLDAGWLLEEDLKPTFDAAIERWKWATGRSTASTRQAK